MAIISALWLLLAAIVAAQTVQPSNNSADLTDPSTSPRFRLNSTGSVKFPGLELAPLGQYAYISRSSFLNIQFSGIIVNTNAENANQVQSHDFNFVSCDPEDYEGSNLGVDDILRIIANQVGSGGDKSSLVFYSTRSNHCNASQIQTLPVINGVFTTLDPVAAAAVVARNFTESSNAAATLTPDPTSYYGGPTQTNGSNSYSQPPTTAIAMIILYSITGVITALFVIIIVTGAVRAHRHPERYGPRNAPGQTRQSRAKGIARAMLETLPIVKFGDHQNVPKPTETTNDDIEMANQTSQGTTHVSKAGDKSVAVTTTSVVDRPTEATGSKPTEESDAIQKPDGSDEAGALGCSICTEDFQKGEEVRVLPCNHKFHPECVDPWLLNVSGTCPLCRINLAQPGEQGTEVADGSEIAPPLNAPFADRRSQAIHHLMAIAYGSREERVNALRQYRTDRRNRNTNQINEEERVSRARRFREALRIRTRRHEANETENEMRSSGIDAITGPTGQMRL